MDEKELERHLTELKQTWRVPPELPLDEMWQHIEARAFGPAGRGKPWIRRLLPMAASVALGFALGQIVPGVLPGGRKAAPPPVAAPPAPLAEQAAFVGVATNYLERVTALLVTLTDESRHGKPLEGTTERARDLLATTRLLLDSPDVRDPHLRDLLDDLELVLVQIVDLPRRAAGPDVSLIGQALDQREVLPRLRVMLAETLPSEP
jgi:urease gamma subunit